MSGLELCGSCGAPISLFHHRSTHDATHSAFVSIVQHAFPFPLCCLISSQDLPGEFTFSSVAAVQAAPCPRPSSTKVSDGCLPQHRLLRKRRRGRPNINYNTRSCLPQHSLKGLLTALIAIQLQRLPFYVRLWIVLEMRKQGNAPKPSHASSIYGVLRLATISTL